jgi:hypothetical protein
MPTPTGSLVSIGWALGELEARRGCPRERARAERAHEAVRDRPAVTFLGARATRFVTVSATRGVCVPRLACALAAPAARD